MAIGGVEAGASGVHITSDSHIVANNSDIVFPPAARRAQAERSSADLYAKRIAAGFPDRITPELKGFIAGLDTAFLATVPAAGAPYIQHRGGPPGFLKVLDERTLGFADFTGNRQYLTSAILPTTSRLSVPDRLHYAAAGQTLGTRAHGGRSGVALTPCRRTIARGPSTRSCSRSKPGT